MNTGGCRAQRELPRTVALFLSKPRIASPQSFASAELIKVFLCLRPYAISNSPMSAAAVQSLHLRFMVIGSEPIGPLLLLLSIFKIFLESCIQMQAQPCAPYSCKSCYWRKKNKTVCRKNGFESKISIDFLLMNVYFFILFILSRAFLSYFFTCMIQKLNNGWCRNLIQGAGSVKTGNTGMVNNTAPRDIQRTQ